MIGRKKSAGKKKKLKSGHTLSKKEKIIVAAVFAALLIFLSYFNIYYSHRMGDTSIFSELLENISATGAPLSQNHAALYDYMFETGVLMMPVEQYEALVFPAEFQAPVNYFEFHFYPIWYVFSPLAWIAPGEIVLGVLEAAAFLAIVCLAYFFLRKRGVSCLISVAFCLLITFYPGWSDSLMGQIYPDRFFMFLAFLLGIALSEEWSNRNLAFAAVLCALGGERAMLIGGALCIGYAILYWKRPIKRRLFEAGAGAALVL